MAKDSQSRKWQITVNNPVEKGYTHERIREILAGMNRYLLVHGGRDWRKWHLSHTYLYPGTRRYQLFNY